MIFFGLDNAFLTTTYLTENKPESLFNPVNHACQRYHSHFSPLMISPFVK